MATFIDSLVSQVNSLFDFLLGWTLSLGPAYALVIISFILTFASTMAQKLLTDQVEIKRLKDESKDINKRMKDHKDDPQKLSELQTEALKKSGEQIKHSFRPLIYTFLPLLLVFMWLREQFTGIEIGFLGVINSWLLTYIILSLIFSIVLRKVLNVQ